MRNTWKIKNLIYLPILIILSCKGPQSLNQIDLADDYNKNKFDLSFNATFSYINDSITALDIQLTTNQLLFSKNTESDYIARYSIAYKVFNNYRDNIAIDTTEIHYTLKQTSNINPNRYHRIKIFAPLGKNYIVQVTFKDENRQFEQSEFIPLKKKDRNSESLFNIQSCQSSYKGNYQKDSFNISYALPVNKTFQVLTFERQSVSAPKPYEVNYTFSFLGEPDNNWLAEIPANKDLKLPPLKEGFYHFICDTVNKQGFSVFNLPEGFPKTTNLNHAIGAMGYLLPRKDYARLLTSTNKRLAFEWEWKKIAGGKNRARNIIKQYYQTVNVANQLFSSFKPGWSTDRGMIFIIYGPPSVVYRYDDSEVWIYGEENNLLSEVFNFNKINSTISNNIYELERSISYKTSWDRMVTSWQENRGY
jgi:GWxTD domain-containing protein